MGTKKFIITINRECGSGGGEIARKLGVLLGVKVYNKALLQSIESKYSLTAEELERIKASHRKWWQDFTDFYKQFGSFGEPYNSSKEVTVTSRQIYNAESTILQEAAQEESCIIVGRSGFHIFANDPSATRIFIIADKSDRIKRVMTKQHLDEKEASQLMEKIDKSRENYTKTFAGCSRYDARNYDMVINVSKIDRDTVVNMLEHWIHSKYDV